MTAPAQTYNGKACGACNTTLRYSGTWACVHCLANGVHRRRSADSVARRRSDTPSKAEAARAERNRVLYEQAARLRVRSVFEWRGPQ